jgi:hypothetical protein
MGVALRHSGDRERRRRRGIVRVHRPTATLVQQRTRCGSMNAGPADMGPEAAPEGASVSSDEWHKLKRKALLRKDLCL